MYAVSQAFLDAALAADQDGISRVDICSPDGSVLYASSTITGGSVSEDSTRAIRRNGSFEWVDETGVLTPRDAADLLAPFGNEVRPYTGLRVAGVDVWIPQGVYAITRPAVATSDAGKVTCQGLDRARRIQRARFTTDYQLATGIDVSLVLTGLLQDRWGLCPAVQSTIPAQNITHDAIYEAESDPWEAAQSIAAAYGAELFFDEVGVPILRPIPDPASSSAAVTYARGLTNVVVSADRELDDEGTYSGVVVKGESTSGAAPVYGEAWDDDPLSPTWRLGPFGQVPYFYSSPLITTATQALNAAAAMLPQRTGILEAVTWEQVPNAALRCSDVANLTDATIGLTGTFMLESIGTSLVVTDSQKVAARARRGFQ